MPRILLVVLTVLGLAAFSPRPLHADELFTGPEPDWVIQADVPDATPELLATASAGVLFLLSDEQVDWDGDEKQTYSRIATLVVDRLGLESAATIQLLYAPEYESLTLTRLVVRRGDQVIDHTETVQADIMRRETRLDEGILDGNLTALLQVPDLRVGDIVDYAYLRRTLPVVDGANRAGEAVMEYDVPVAYSRAIVNWPADWPIYISGWPARVDFAQENAEGIIRHTWTRQGHIPVMPEPMVPFGYTDNVTIQYSAFPDWTGVTTALSPHYMQSYPLGPEWDAKLRAIQAEYTYDGDRAIAALRAVQNDLRYVSLSIGAGGLLARQPAEVTQTGYGDCKDKALLLRTMLDKMGIEAYVALTDMDEGHGLDELKPSIWSFDHAIVKVVVDGSTHWMDPTASHEGGDLYTTVVPDFGHALPLSGGDQQQLEPIDVGYNSVWSRNVDELYNFTPLGAYLTVTTSFYGPAANAIRQRAAGMPIADLTEEYRAYYAGRYPGLRLLAPVGITDDPVSNLVTMTERYLVPAPALFGEMRKNFEFAAEDYTSDLPPPGETPRVAPLDFGPLQSFYHRVTVQNAPIDFNVPEAASVYNDAFGYSFTGYVPAPGEMVLEWSFNRNLRTLQPEQVDQVLRDAEIVAGNSWFTWDLRP